jgi:capsular polysaccharide biosynthesis protein
MLKLRTRLRTIPFVRRLSDRVRVESWDFFAALQSSDFLDSSFVLWTSSGDASRRKSSSPLKPYLCRLQRTVLVEPRFGFAIADHGLLIETSVSNAYAARDTYLRTMFGLPSPIRYLEAKIRANSCADLDSVVSMATAWPHNYFHFYRDFLPKILLMEEAEVDPALPVLVPAGLFDQPFFQEAVESKRLSRWNFVPIREQFIKANTIVFCSSNQFFVMDRSVTPEPELLRLASSGTKFLESPQEVLALLDVDVIRPQAGAQRRIFLTRSADSSRYLLNYEEIEPLLRRHGFETIDTAGMSLRQQAQLFSECRYLIGVHGAGLTNIIYAHDHDLSVLQIRQPGEEHLVTDFALMCHSFGFDHQEIFGSSERGHRDDPFRIDADIFRDAVDSLLTSTRS